jgi:hypothetical protein
MPTFAPFSAALRWHVLCIAICTQITLQRQRKDIAMDWRSAWTKVSAALRVPLVKYGLITLGVGLWAFGLADQLYSTDAMMKYLVISALIVAVAVI